MWLGPGGVPSVRVSLLPEGGWLPPPALRCPPPPQMHQLHSALCTARGEAELLGGPTLAPASSPQAPHPPTPPVVASSRVEVSLLEPWGHQEVLCRSNVCTLVIAVSRRSPPPPLNRLRGSRVGTSALGPLPVHFDQDVSCPRSKTQHDVHDVAARWLCFVIRFEGGTRRSDGPPPSASGVSLPRRRI